MYLFTKYKHFDMKSCISMETKLYRLLRINIYNFNYVNYLKLYLNKLDLI